MTRKTGIGAAGVLVALAALVNVAAQSKPAVSPAEYGQFESLTPGSASGGLSWDGRWIAYGVNRANGNNELRIARTSSLRPDDPARASAWQADDNPTVVPFGG